MGLRFQTAGALVNQVALELGLIPTALADPYASTNPNITQIEALLTSLGDDLLRRRQWTWLQWPWIFSTNANQGQYALPDDFDSVIPCTAWNRTTRLPLGGPLSPQEYEYLKARLVGVVFTVLERAIGGQMRLYPDTNTPGAYVLAYEYISRNWVQPATAPWVTLTAYVAGQIVTTGANGGGYYYCQVGGTSGAVAPVATTPGGILDGTVTWVYIPAWSANTGYGGGGQFAIARTAAGQVYKTGIAGISALGDGPKDRGGYVVDGTATWIWLVPLTTPTTDSATASADVVWFDAALVRKGLALEFRKAKGLPYDEADFERALGQAMDADSHSPTISLNKGSVLSAQFIGQQSIPSTGYGV